MFPSKIESIFPTIKSEKIAGGISFWEGISGFFQAIRISSKMAQFDIHINIFPPKLYLEDKNFLTPTNFFSANVDNKKKFRQILIYFHYNLFC